MAVNYNPNVALIQGAAAIGRSTMPADLSGLDKVIEGGRTMLENARKERQKIDDMLNLAADKVLAKAGGLGEEMFSYATDQVEKYKQEYLQGVSMRGAEGDKMKRAAMNKMIQLSNFAQEHKELNNISAENYKNGMFSTALTNDQKTILTSIFDENYTLSENSDGEMVYNINVNGENKQVTYDEYRELTSYLKDETLGNTYRTTRQSFLKEKDFKYDEFKHVMMQSIPNNELKFKLSIYDDIQGQKFYDMLLEDKSLTDEVLQSIANADPNDNITLDNIKIAGTDKDKEGTIKAAIIDAIVNPDNDAFDLQRSRTIMAEKLTIAAQKKHNTYHDELAEQRQRELNALGNKQRDTYYMPAVGGYVPKELVDGDVAILNEDPRDIPVRTSYNNVQFRKQAGQYQIYQPPYTDPNTKKIVEGKFVNVTKDQLIATLQLDEKYGITRSANVPVYDPDATTGNVTPTPEDIDGDGIPNEVDDDYDSTQEFDPARTTLR